MESTSKSRISLPDTILIWNKDIREMNINTSVASGVYGKVHIPSLSVENGLRKESKTPVSSIFTNGSQVFFSSQEGEEGMFFFFSYIFKARTWMHHSYHRMIKL